MTWQDANDSALLHITSRLPESPRTKVLCKCIVKHAWDHGDPLSPMPTELNALLQANANGTNYIHL